YSNSSATYVYSLSLHDALPIYIFLVHNSYFPDHRRSSDMNGRCFGGNHAISFTFNMIGVDFHAEYSHFIWIDMQKTSNTGRTFSQSDICPTVQEPKWLMCTFINWHRHFN